MIDETLKTKIDEFVDSHRDDIIADLATLVEIPSISKPGSPEPMPFGEECAKVLDVALKMAESKGMKGKNYGNWYGIATRGESDKSVGIFSHLDVVEVDDRWTFPPFKVTEKDGWLFGRGVSDDKLAAIIGMYTSQALDELDLGHNIKLELYLGCSEEKGMQDLDKYISRQKQPDFSMVPDFIFPVSVGGAGMMKFDLSTKADFTQLKNITGGGKGQRIPIEASVIYTGESQDKLTSKDGIDCEKVEDGIKITAHGRAASGFGANDGINAIEKLLEYILEANILSGRDLEVMEIIGKISENGDGKKLGIACEDETFGSLKVNPLILEEKDDVLTLTVSVSYPTTITGSEIAEKIKEQAIGFEYKEAYCEMPWGVDKDDERVGLLMEAWRDVFKSDRKYMTGGNTYASKLQNAVNYGPKDFSKCPFIPEDKGNIHGPDETRSVKNLLEAVKVYIRALVLLDQWYGEQK
jgi:succinyl-diaminopimelate desuccinylase